MKIKQKIKIKGAKVPVFIEGEEAGVIATQIIEIPDDWTYIDISEMTEAGNKMLRDNVEVVSEEIKK